MLPRNTGCTEAEDNSAAGGNLRITMLSQRFPPANWTGAPLQALRLSQALIAKGASVRVITTCPLACKETAYDIDGVSVSTIRFCDLPGLASASRFASAAIHSGYIRDTDIVHGHALSPMVLGYALARGGCGPPLLVKPSLGGAHCEGEMQQIVSSFAAPVLLKAHGKIDRFAVLDDDIYNDLLASGTHVEKLSRVDNGIDVMRFRPASEGERGRLRAAYGLGSRKVILFCGQFTPRKGVQELLDAWRECQLAHRGAVLVFCGEGPLLANITKVVEQYSGAIACIGQQTDVASVMRMADVLILPSRAESFGNVVLEALATGLPVAATNCGIAGRVVKSGKTGWPIETTTRDAIHRCLKQVLADENKWREMGVEGVKVAAKYSFDKIADDYFRIYEGLLAGSKN